MTNARMLDIFSITSGEIISNCATVGEEPSNTHTTRIKCVRRKFHGTKENSSKSNARVRRERERCRDRERETDKQRVR